MCVGPTGPVNFPQLGHLTKPSFSMLDLLTGCGHSAHARPVVLVTSWPPPSRFGSNHSLQPFALSLIGTKCPSWREVGWRHIPCRPLAFQAIASCTNPA